MSEIYENTTLSGVSSKAIEMDNMTYQDEEDYETLEAYENAPQRKAEAVEVVEEKSSTSHRMKSRESGVSLRFTLIQCSVVILVAIVVSVITGVVVYKLTEDAMQDMQLATESRLPTSSALSNQSESIQDQITLFEKEMRQNVTILEQEMKDNVNLLEQQMKEKITVLQKQMKDNDSELEQKMKNNITVLEKQMKDNVITLEQKTKYNFTVLKEQIKNDDTAFEQQMKDNFTILDQKMLQAVSDIKISKLKLNNTYSSLLILNETFKRTTKQTEIDINNIRSNATHLHNKLTEVQQEQSQLAARFGDRSMSIAAFTATQPAYYGRSNSSNYSTLNFSRTIYNLGGDFNSSTGMFTCTKPGTYYFSVFLMKKRDTVRVDQVYCNLYKNYYNIIYIAVDPTDDDTDKGSAQAANSVVIHLDTGDDVYLGRCRSVLYMEHWSSFSGFLLYPDA